LVLQTLERIYRNHVDSGIWPIARGLFDIFHVVRLFRWFDALARRAGQRPAWNPSLYAAAWIALIVVPPSAPLAQPHGRWWRDLLMKATPQAETK
jgi:hypothetical protein